MNITLAMTPLHGVNVLSAMILSYEGVNIIFTCYMTHLLSGFIVATDARGVMQLANPCVL